MGECGEARFCVIGGLVSGIPLEKLGECALYFLVVVLVVLGHQAVTLRALREASDRLSEIERIIGELQSSFGSTSAGKGS